MLQYPLPTPPLSGHNIHSHHHQQPQLNRPVHAQPASPLAISTNIQSSTLSSASISSPSFFSSPKLPRSPYISSRKLSSPAVQSWTPPPPVAEEESLYHPRSPSSSSSTIEDVLEPGDLIGQGALLQGETVRRVSIGPTTPAQRQAGNDDDQDERVSYEEPAREFEVVRRLGTGSYAVVYLVKEVLYRPPPSEDGHVSLVGTMDMDGKSFRRPSTIYGREYAIKCLSKANLDGEALAAQMSEVTIHQSLHSHPNIVTLHRTLETSSFLLLLLEYVPGEDLFYFLEQARDHYETDIPNTADTSVSSSRTPPTPSLLSTLNPAQLLSKTRLRLVASMFSQMCDAVAACHAQQVYHRDIKPENFIVTDGWVTLPDGRHERKVVVKLTDFGLSTTDLDSSDMDCGSAPYMSYECRNNVAPTYRPRAADVWSLGIVLINMLYHYNPWTDTTEGACSSFDLYRQQPINFFMHRFAGMTRPVAEYLTNNIFCILDGPNDDSQRATASDFGNWAKDLPMHLGDQAGVNPQTRPSPTTSVHHRISSSGPLSHRPSSRRTSGTSQIRTPAARSRSLSRAPSLGPTYEKEVSELSTVFDEEPDELDEFESMHSRSTSNNKRRKRGARKGKGVGSPATSKDETLATLAVASQSLAREVSKASRASSRATSVSRTSASRTSASSPASPQPSPLPSTVSSAPSPVSPPPPPSSSTPAPTMVKKASKWKLSFGKSSAGRISPLDETAPATETSTASNVTSLLMGLSAPPTVTYGISAETETWDRGRRSKTSLMLPTRDDDERSRSRGAPSTYAPSVDSGASVESADGRSNRAISPSSTRSGRPLASSASSTVSSNWRNSISTNSSAGTSSSAFTRYSNSSLRSVSTTATSVSASSWRTSGGKSGNSVASSGNHPAHHPPSLPKNIKYMTGVPWELAQPPRDMQPHAKPENMFGAPQVRKVRPRKSGTDAHLGTITERPSAIPTTDAGTSTTDLSARDNNLDDGEGPRKVPKAQINALAKMLSALRR